MVAVIAMVGIIVGLIISALIIGGGILIAVLAAKGTTQVPQTTTETTNQNDNK